MSVLAMPPTKLSSGLGVTVAAQMQKANDNESDTSGEYSSEKHAAKHLLDGTYGKGRLDAATTPLQHGN